MFETLDARCRCTIDGERRILFCPLHKAAPDMLEALRNCERAITMQAYDKSLDAQDELALALFEARAIIAKAEGSK